MVALGAGRAAVFPLARQAEVIRALAADMVVAEMEVKALGVGGHERAVGPLAARA